MCFRLLFGLCIFWSLSLGHGWAQPFYKTTDAKVSFFSDAPIEDIQAVSNQGTSVIDFKSGEISFQVRISSLDFPKERMEEHFNENFMESHRYPMATFRGTFKENINPSREGTYPVHLQGVLTVHGQEDQRNIKAELVVKGKDVILTCEFEVACKTHDIEIPRILWKNIAEVVQVDVKARYQPINK